MEIIVFEGGCACTRGLLPLVKKVLAEMKIDEIVYTSQDFNKMVAMGISGLPALVVDGKVLCEGEVPDEDKLKEVISSIK